LASYIPKQKPVSIYLNLKMETLIDEDRRGQKRKAPVRSIPIVESESKCRRGKLFPIQDDEEYTIVEDENKDERYALVRIQGKMRRVPIDRPVRVYADGIYDLFHFGHARSLMQAKNLFPDVYLVVGVCNDETTLKMKGKTVMTGPERAECVSHCRYVDEVILDAPWVATVDFLEKHNIDFVAHGEDISLDENGVDVYKGVKEAGKFLLIKRTEGISTTDLILRIIKDYDEYVRRNLRRGKTYKEMNVGFVKEKSIQLQEKMEELKEGLKNQKDKLVVDFKHWTHIADELLLNFLHQFEKVNKNVTPSSPPAYPASSGASDYSRNLEADSSKK
jgi:choline-phosphate cytidylyltransferase